MPLFIAVEFYLFYLRRFYCFFSCYSGLKVNLHCLDTVGLATSMAFNV